MDKFSAMKAFVRVVEAGTFRAADSLGVPKAQVTRLVQSLEEELKTLLLNRTTRRVSVTVLRIDAPSAVANLILIPALDDFCARYPEIAR